MGDLIVVDSAVVAYQGEIVLNSVSMSASDGECVGLYGPNGSGKSTLIRLIHGLVPLSQGSVYVDHERMTPASARSIRRQMGYMPQFGHVDPRIPVSAYDAVLMGRYGHAGLFRRYRADDHDAVRDALEMVGVVHLAGRPFGQLSGGEQQRVLLARVLASRPRLMLLDEPTASLDWDSRNRICEIVESASKKLGVTTIIVSHDVEILKSLCRRIVVMNSGRIVGECTPDRLVNDSKTGPYDKLLHVEELS